MASEPVTLTKLLGKPDFQPDKRLIGQTETLIVPHIRKRRANDHLFPVTTDDLTTLLEEHVEQLDLYDDLSTYGSGVEGLTLFSFGKKPTVRIAPELSEATNKNRLKSTLAHELGHVILHDPMFQSRSQGGLFDASATAYQVSYRDGDSSASQTDLYEYQAWFFCRALLMPSSEVGRLIQERRNQTDHIADIWHESAVGHEIVRGLALHFGVSEALARIHLVKTGALSKDAPPPSLF